MARGIIPLVGVKLLLESGVIVEELVLVSQKAITRHNQFPSQISPMVSVDVNFR